MNVPATAQYVHVEIFFTLCHKLRKYAYDPLGFIKAIKCGQLTVSMDRINFHRIAKTLDENKDQIQWAEAVIFSAFLYNALTRVSSRT